MGNLCTDARAGGIEDDANHYSDLIFTFAKPIDEINSQAHRRAPAIRPNDIAHDIA